MKQRPTGLFGLTLHAIKLKWSGLDRTRKLALVGVALAFALALGMWSQCLLGSNACSTSGGCPYSGAASAQPSSPCSR